MKIILTGSDGFIGKAFCQVMRNKGVEVTAIDRKNGHEADEVPGILRHTYYDAVIHLAAQTSVFNDDNYLIEKDNISTFMKIADACHRHGTKLVYASSSTANPRNTTSMYGISKHFDEQYARVYCPSATGVRLHNVYGPNPRQGTLLYCLLNKAAVSLYNNGENMRCFTYIDDAIKGLIYAMTSDLQLVNVANPQVIPVRTFAREVQKYHQVDITLVPRRRELDNPSQEVDERIFRVPLHYTPVSRGVQLSVAGTKIRRL